jgi:hypothetical protein
MSTAVDMKALDVWHAGAPISLIGPDDDTTLDLWHAGEPINTYAEDGGSPPATAARPVVFSCT